MKSKNGLRIGLALVLAGGLFAGCEEESSSEKCVEPDAAVSDTLDITIFSTTTSMVETGFDPFIQVTRESADNIFELVGFESITQSGGNLVAAKFVLLSLPSKKSGTFTSADDAEIAYVEDFDFTNDTFSLAYVSTSATVTVDSAGAVGCLWAGTFSGDMADIGGVGADTTATGSFSTVREVDDL